MDEKSAEIRLKNILAAATPTPSIFKDDNSIKVMIKNNLTSGIDIANWPKDKFKDFCKDQVFSDDENSEKFYNSAKTIAANVGLTFLKEQQEKSPYLKNIAFRGPGGSPNDFSQIFGKLDYFFTDESSSIFGPAAYFHDLLRIINDPKLIKEKKGFNKDHYAVKKRRPDLYEIPLDGAHTTQELPHLEVANNILARKYFELLPLSSGADLDTLNFEDRNKWYQAQVFDGLTKDKHWFSPPAVLLIEETRSYLKSFKLSLVDVYFTLSDQCKNDCIFLNFTETTDKNIKKNFSLEYLGLTSTELDWLNGLIDKTDKTDDETFSNKLNLTDEAADFNVFLDLTKLDKKRLGKIIPYEGYYDPKDQNFYENLFINSNGQEIIKIGLDTDAQSKELTKSESIRNLSTDRIKRISFFTFLANKLSISYKDTQSIIDAIGDLDQKSKKKDISSISDEQLLKTAKIMWLHNKSKLPISDVCIFINDLSQDQIDHIYNDQENLIRQSKKTDLVNKKISTAGTWLIGFLKNPTDNDILSKLIIRLSSSLHISPLSLKILLTSISISKISTDGDFVSRLYRAVTLCKLCVISAIDLAKISLMTPDSGYTNTKDCIVDMLNALNKRSLDPVLRFYSATQLIKQNSFNVDALLWIVSDPPNTVERLKREDQAQSFLKVVNEKLKSCDPTQQKSMLFHLIAEHVSLSEGIILKIADHLKLDNRITQDQLLLIYKIAATIEMLNLSYTDATQVASSCDEISLLLRMYIGNNISLENIRQFVMMNDFQKEFKDPRNDFIKYFTDKDETEAASDENRFLDLTGWDKEQFDALRKLFSGFKLPESPSIDSINSIARFNNAFKLLEKINSNIHILEYANKLLSASQNDSQTEETLVDFTGKTLATVDPNSYDEARRAFAMHVRDVLVDKVLYLYADGARKDLNIQKVSDLSEYLLLDLEMSGCFSTSYIVQGIATLQSYLQRCRLGVEIGVEIGPDLHEEWWPWIEAYRVWEANRKVLLYPENYIEPDLRTEQSAEFKQLTQALLQSNLDTDNVDGIFRDYLQKVEKVSKLIYCDAHCREDNSSKRYTVYLFAHTLSSPHEYYWRTFQYSKSSDGKSLRNFKWDYWKKIDVKINSGLINSIFAFNRLFIFWVEPKFSHTQIYIDQKPGHIENKVSYKIYFSYYHSNGTWEHPQTCHEDTFELDKSYVGSIYRDGILQLIKEEAKDCNRNLNYFNYCLNTVKLRYVENDLLIKCMDKTMLLDPHFVKTLLTPPPPWSDSIGWNEPQYYGVIQVVPLDNKLYFFARDQYGIQLHECTPDLEDDDKERYIWKINLQPKDGLGLSDKLGWDQPQYYETIQIVPLNHKLYVFARGVNGIQLHEYNPNNGSWNTNLSQGNRTDWTKALGWDGSEHYKTIRLVSLGECLYLSGIGVKDNGLELYEFDTSSVNREWTKITVPIPQTGAKGGLGWDDWMSTKAPDHQEHPEYYETIRVVADNKNKCLYILGRDGNEVQLHKYSTQNKAWDILGRGTELKWTDKNNWNKSEHYKTIRLVLLGKFLYLSGIGVNDNGLELYKFDASSANSNWTKINVPIPQTGAKGGLGWDDWMSTKTSDKKEHPDYYETIRMVAYNSCLYILGRDGLGLQLHKYDESKIDPKKNIDGWSLNLQPTDRLGWTDKKEDYWYSPVYYKTLQALTLENRLFLLIRSSQGMVYCPYHIDKDFFDRGHKDDHSYQFDLYKSAKQILTLPSNEEFLLDEPAEGDKFGPESSSFPTLSVSTRADLILISGSPDRDVLINNISQTYFISRNQHNNYPAIIKLSATSFIRRLYDDLLLGNPKTLYEELSSKNLVDKDDYLTFVTDFDKAKYKDLYDTLNKIDFKGGFSPYLWEIFFHLPFLVAKRLNSLQRFKEARDWYHFIFNPLMKSDEAFRFPPLKTIDKIKDGGYEYLLDDKAHGVDHDAITSIYHDHSFDPHMIAQSRNIAYKKAIVMNYIQNLIDWADNLFTQDTRETVTQATNLYMMANDLLGKKPRAVGSENAQDKVITFNSYLMGAIVVNEAIDIALKGIETSLNFPINPISTPLHEFNLLFGIPENKDFIAYWDKIEDRLFKIRHCLNINGVKQALDLFSPEIDPRQLVRAAASGSLGASSFLPISIPYYRFHVLLEQTRSFVNQVMQLGSSLLSTVEKQESESLQILSLGHQSKLLNLISNIKKRQVDEANCALAQVKVNVTAAENRRKYYAQLINKGLISEETHAKNLKISSQVSYTIAGGLELAAGATSAIPQFITGGAGAFGSPVFLVSEGGSNMSGALHLASSETRLIGDILNFAADDLLQEATYKRRDDEWKQQLIEAQSNCDQLVPQLTIANIQAEIAKNEYDQYQEQIKQQNELLDYYQTKFTSVDLYRWMMGQLQTLYKQAYDLAVASAKKTEKAYQFEANQSTKIFISNNYYSFFNKGLLAGESLMFDINRLEQAYLDDNKRLYEIQKTFSLKDTFSDVFLKFIASPLESKKTLKFEFTDDHFKEFDDQVNRRIKRVSVSIPGVAKPYQNTYFILRQSSNGKTNTDALLQPRGEEIILSTSVSDPGLFSASLQDSRYLPFEGTTVNSTWELELRIDKDKVKDVKISDIIFNLEYTAEKKSPSLSI